MKNFLRSTWFIAVLALVLGLGTQAWVLNVRIHQLEAEAAAAVPEEAIPDIIAWSFLTPDIGAMQEELRQRLEAVAAREKDLDDYELRLKAERAEIEKVRADIERMRVDLSTTVTDVQIAEQKNLKTLAATYANLTPAGALAIFREMDDEMVVKILAFMKPDPVGQILEEMARTRDGTGTHAGRAALLTNKLRLLRTVRAEDNP